MGPINILQMGYREFTTRWSDIRLSVFLLIAAIMVEGIALDLFGIDAQIASNILLLFLSIRIFRTLMGEDPNSAPFFPYVGNSMLIGLLCGLLVIPLVIAVVIIGFGIWADGFETLGFWMLALIVLAIPVALGYFYLFTRLFYCLPGVAIRRRPYGFFQGWGDSKGVAFPLVFASLLVTIIFAVVGVIALFIFGILISIAYEAAGSVASGIELVVMNLLVAILVGGWLLFLTVMQGTVYREHTHNPKSEVVDIF